MPKKRFALVPSEREKECNHPMGFPYTGKMPCTGLEQCPTCGTIKTESNWKWQPGQEPNRAHFLPECAVYIGWANPIYAPVRRHCWVDSTYGMFDLKLWFSTEPDMLTTGPLSVKSLGYGDVYVLVQDWQRAGSPQRKIIKG